MSNNYGLWIQGKVVSDLQPGLLGTWGDDHITNRPCLFTWHPFCLQFKELGNIVYQGEGEDGQNIPDKEQRPLNQSFDKKYSLVSSPVVGDLEERVADCDVTFYRHCHHCVDRAWEKKMIVWFGWGEKNKKKYGFTEREWKCSDEIESESGTVQWSMRLKIEWEESKELRIKWKLNTCEAHVCNGKKYGYGESVNTVGGQGRPQ